MATKLTFAVLIACKNRVPELREAVSSVLGQQRVPDEFVIIDDGSEPPLSKDMFADFSGSNLIQILRNEQNVGPAASYNRGANAVDSDIICTLDSDDCYLPTHLRALESAWQGASTDTVCIASGFYWCTDELKPYRTQVVGREVTRNELITRDNIVGGSSVFSSRRITFLAVGGYPDQRALIDWGLLLRLAQAGRIMTLKSATVLYRSPSTSKIENITRGRRNQIVAAAQMRRAFSREDREASRPLMRRRVARQLAMEGKRMKALGFQLSASDRLLDADTFKLILMGVLGRRRYFWFLDRLARIRAAK